VAHAQKASPAFAGILAGVDAAGVHQTARRWRAAGHTQTRVAGAQQQARAKDASNVFGGFSTMGFGPGMPRVFASPGTIYEPEGTRRDYWRMARAIFAAGFRPGELIHNCFSYHFVPAGSMMETGAHALGCTVFPRRHGPDRAAGAGHGRTATRGLHRHPQLPENHSRKAAEMGVPLPSVKKAMLGGEAFPQPARLVRRTRHCRLPVLRHGRSGPDCL
jgi:phenylacetate-CoA ligase